MIGFADQNTGFENRNQRDNIEFKVEFLIRLGDVTKCSQIERDFVCRTVFETFCLAMPAKAAEKAKAMTL